MFIFIFLAFAAVCLCVLRRLQVKNKIYSDPPILYGWLPLVGHAYRIMGHSVQMLQGIMDLGERCVKQGGITTAYLGINKTYFVTNPDDILKITNTCMQKHSIFDFGKPFIGQGLLTADAAVWKRTRKVLNPAFNLQVLNGFMEVFNSQAVKLTDQFSKEVGKEFDQDYLIRINALETIYMNAFGVCDEESDTNEMFQYIPPLLQLLEIVNTRIQKFWIHSDFIFNLSSEKKQQDKVLKQLTGITKRMIEKKKMERGSNVNSNIETGKFKSFMDIILDLAEDTDCLTDQQVQWETDTIIAAGHDTVATSLTLILAMVGSYPEVQQKVYEEITNVLGDSNTVGKDDLSRLVYIEAIIKEVQRLYPVTAILGRRVNEDIRLGKYTLKANSECLLFLSGALRHPMWGPDADQFRPERWLDKESLPDPKYYGAFGLGRRNCIGKAYGMMTLKILIVHIIRKYHVSSDISNMVLKMQSLIHPHSGYHITLAFRK